MVPPRAVRSRGRPRSVCPRETVSPIRLPSIFLEKSAKRSGPFALARRTDASLFAAECQPSFRTRCVASRSCELPLPRRHNLGNARRLDRRSLARIRSSFRSGLPTGLSPAPSILLTSLVSSVFPGGAGAAGTSGTLPSIASPASSEASTLRWLAKAKDSRLVGDNRARSTANPIRARAWRIRKRSPPSP
jgi:hypothetical protein